ncbi:DNA polymerase I [Linum perenne]
MSILIHCQPMIVFSVFSVPLLMSYSFICCLRMVSFGMEDFAERYGSLKPSQFVDMISLVGDKADNIPGVGGIGDVNALKLITKFGKNQL